MHEACSGGKRNELPARDHSLATPIAPFVVASSYLGIRNSYGVGFQ